MISGIEPAALSIQMIPLVKLELLYVVKKVKYEKHFYKVYFTKVIFSQSSYLT